MLGGAAAGVRCAGVHVMFLSRRLIRNSKCGVIAKLVNICFVMDYDTIIALFTVNIGPLYRLMGVVVDLWKHLFVLVGDYVYAGTF